MDGQGGEWRVKEGLWGKRQASCFFLLKSVKITKGLKNKEFERILLFERCLEGIMGNVFPFGV